MVHMDRFSQSDVRQTSSQNTWQIGGESLAQTAKSRPRFVPNGSKMALAKYLNHTPLYLKVKTFSNCWFKLAWGNRCLTVWFLGKFFDGCCPYPTLETLSYVVNAECENKKNTENHFQHWCQYR